MYRASLPCTPPARRTRSGFQVDPMPGGWGNWVVVIGGTFRSGMPRWTMPWMPSVAPKPGTPSRGTPEPKPPRACSFSSGVMSDSRFVRRSSAGRSGFRKGGACGEARGGHGEQPGHGRGEATHRRANQGFHVLLQWCGATSRLGESAGRAERRLSPPGRSEQPGFPSASIRARAASAPIAGLLSDRGIGPILSRGWLRLRGNEDMDSPLPAALGGAGGLIRRVARCNMLDTEMAL